MRSTTGQILSVREYNRKGGKKVLGPSWTPNKVHKVKLLYPLDDSIAAIVQGQDAGLPARRGRFNSDLAACQNRIGDVEKTELSPPGDRRDDLRIAEDQTPRTFRPGICPDAI